jgi:hypothetical protein
MATVSFCPGSASIKGAPELKVKRCPECGAEVEVFSNLSVNPCSKCGFQVYSDAMNCIHWCRYAKECVGEELYEQFMRAGEVHVAEKPQPSEGTDCPLEYAEAQ